MSSEINEKIITLSVRGMTAHAISRMLGLSHGMVKSRVYRLRCSGFCPSLSNCRSGTEDAEKWIEVYRKGFKPTSFRDASPPKVLGTGAPVQLGSMGILFAALGPEVSRYIAEQVSDKTTVAEYVAGIVKDVIIEEMGL